MTLYKSLIDKKLVLVSGKGGTGKTTFAASLAILARQHGKRVLLVENSICEQLPPLFSKKSIGHREVVLSEGISGINLDRSECFREYVVEHLGLAHVYEKIFRQKVVSNFLQAMPGLAETMLLGRLFHTCELSSPSKYDLVIFDAPASGHFLSMMTTPDAVNLAGFVGPLANEVNRVRSFLSDKNKVATIVMTLPEPLVLSETLEFVPKVAKEVPAALAGVILNRYLGSVSSHKLQLQNLQKKFPSLKEAVAYHMKLVEQGVAQYKLLTEGLLERNLSLPVLTLKEHGQIPEPFDSNFNYFSS